MLDLQYICNHLDQVATNCRNRGVDVDLDKIVTLRGRRGELITGGDELRREQKATSSQIPTAENDESKQELIARGRELRVQLQGLDGELAGVEAELRAEQSCVPNMSHPDAPVAQGDDGHVEVRRWGDVPEFDFEPLDHVALAEAHDLIDFDAGTRVAGHGDIDGNPATDMGGGPVDLDDHGIGRIEVSVREVGADHDREVDELLSADPEPL